MAWQRGLPGPAYGFCFEDHWPPRGRGFQHGPEERHRDSRLNGSCQQHPGSYRTVGVRSSWHSSQGGKSSPGRPNSRVIAKLDLLAGACWDNSEMMIRVSFLRVVGRRRARRLRGCQRRDQTTSRRRHRRRYRLCLPRSDLVPCFRRLSHRLQRRHYRR